MPSRFWRVYFSSPHLALVDEIFDSMNSQTFLDHHLFDYRLLSDLSVWAMIAVVVEFLFWIFTWWYWYPVNSVPFASMHCEKCIALVFAHWFSWPSFEFNFSLMLLSLVVIQAALFSFSVNLARPFCVYAFRRFAFSWIDVFESIHWSMWLYFAAVLDLSLIFTFCLNIVILPPTCADVNF